MDMVVAAGGGERDEAVDAGILAASESRNDRDVLLNEKLTTELRPTLFLAQLSNLLAGNISIVHKVTGSSRTFMGEEGAGVVGHRDGGCAHPLRPVDACAGRRRLPDRTFRHAARLRAWPATCIAARGSRSGSARARKAAASSPARAAPSWCWNRANTPKAAGSKIYAELGPGGFRPRQAPQWRTSTPASPTLLARTATAGRRVAGDLRRLRRACGDRRRKGRARRQSGDRRARLLHADRAHEGSAVPVRRGAGRARRRPQGAGYPAFEPGEKTLCRHADEPCWQRRSAITNSRAWRSSPRRAEGCQDRTWPI